ncbi:uncharacterized protein LOC143199769 isoform X1 [Rhynchophorus ferrugineus]|uniref:uncharacterized protein LOC143199769 isoform X1 n=1 Tax=Rhynchophorus ferrugineus TaxID=354439 RepID=UPI003FCC6FCE
MENIKDCEVVVEEEEHIDVATVFRNIYCSCDIDNTDLVPVSRLIEFIQPFMIEDLNALEDLRNSLDPENKNVFVSSDHFYDVIGRWSQKIAAGTSDDDEFQPSCRLPAIEDKHLPYSHSTPRASLGDKLLKCKDLLNLSNISGYSLSTSRLDTTNHNDVEKLEEEIKKLEHQILKLTGELTITKQQLTSSEEQNDVLQQNFDRLNKRLHAEQQIIEHLQSDRKYHEELREEIQFLKDTVEILKKQLSQSEKDNLYYKNQMDELEQERMTVERKNEVLTRQHQECLQEILDMKTEIEAKEQQIETDQKDYNDLKMKLNEQRDVIDQLRQEIDTANYAKLMLEKSVKSKLSIMGSNSSLGNSDIFIKTPSPISIQEDFQTPPSFNNSNLLFHNGAQCKTPMPIRRMVLLKNTSTPFQIPPNVSICPKVSPVNLSDNTQNEQQDSEEDWKSAPTDNQNSDMESNGNTESLQLEIHKADPLLITRSYDTLMFEKDEHIVSLEDEIEILKDFVEKTESQREDLTSQLSELKENNKDLLSHNFILTNEVEISRTTINTLRQRLTQLEQNGVIMEHPQEYENDSSGRLSEIEETLKDKELTIEELKVKLESSGSLEDEINKLKEDLKVANEKLEMRTKEYREMEAENNSLQAMIKSLENQKQDINENLIKQYEFQLQIKLREELSAKDNELASLRQQVDEEKNGLIADFERQIQENECEFTRKINEKESELIEIKENLEKKIVSEFEGKVRDSVDAEERILKLGLKCGQQQQELNELLTQLYAERKSVLQAKNEIETLNSQNVQLRSKIDSLQETISNLEDEQVNKIHNINAVIIEIEKHLDNRNELIRELRRLNKNMESSLHEAESNLKKKIGEVLELRNGLKKDIEVKNNLWSQMEMLRKDLETSKEEKKELMSKNQSLTDSFEMLNIEHNNLLIIYDLEVKKNLDMSGQISHFTEERNYYNTNWNKLNTDYNNQENALKHQIEANRQLGETVSRLEKQVKELTQVEKMDFSSQTDALDEMNKEVNVILQELENKLITEINKNNETTRTLKETSEILCDRNRELCEMKRKITDSELMMKNSVDQHIKENSVLSKDLAKAQEFLVLNQIEISNLNTKLVDELRKNESLTNELQTKLNELDSIKKKVSLNDIEAKENIQKLSNKLAEVNLLLSNKQKDIEEIQISHIQALDELDNERRMLKTQLAHINSDLIQKNEINLKLEQKVLVLEQEKSALLTYKDVNQKLQEEVETNKIIFENMRMVAKERDNLSCELRESQTVNSNLQVLLNTRQLECLDLQAKCLVLEEKSQQQAELIKQSELLLKQNQEELKKACFQKDLLNNELTRINSMSSINNSDQMKNLEETKSELEQPTEDSRRLASDVDETRKRFSDRGRLSSDRDSGRGKSYFRQQATIDRLKQKVEQLEIDLRNERSRNEDLKSKLSLTESQMLSWETRKEASSKQWHSSSSDSPYITEGKTINKFTLRSPKVQSTCSFSADSPTTNYEAVIEVPPLDIIGIANILQDLDLSETCSSEVKINQEETEKRVLNLISVLRTSSSDVYERIEKHTEKYRVQYEGILTLLSDVSYRLRDHVCIGTAEPIMPVFVLLEEVKIQLKQLVENVGQVGALIYEDKMRKIWSLLTDYIVHVQKEHEISSRTQKNTSPKQSGLRKRKSKTAPDRGHTEPESSQKKKRRLPRIRLTMLFLVIAGVSVIMGLIIQVYCRMTVAESQFCPLDGVITRINDGLPPM